MNVDHVVVGGGLAGLLAAHSLSSRGESVVLIERGPTVGGLLRSVVHVDDDGREHAFDLGTHYLLLTGDAEVDEDLVSFIQPEDWNWFDHSLPEGQFLNGRLDTSTGCLNACHFDDETLARLFSEFFMAPGDGDRAETLADAIRADFGDTALDSVYRPIIDKFAGVEPEKLAPEVWSAFAPTRIKLLEDARAGWLKREPFFDRRLAFAHRDEGVSAIRKGYPRAGGIGQWIEGLELRLRTRGIEIWTGAQVVSAVLDGDRVVSLAVEREGQEHRIASETVVHTLPPAIVCRMLDIEPGSRPPRFRDLHLLHLVLSGPPRLDELHWITVYDPACSAYRVTLHDNMAGGPANGHSRIGVEVLASPSASGTGGDAGDVAQRIEAELRQMSILDERTEVTACWQQTLPRALPLNAPGWKSVVAAQVARIEDRARNVRLVGAAGGAAFGQLAVIRDVYDKI